MPNSLLTTKYP